MLDFIFWYFLTHYINSKKIGFLLRCDLQARPRSKKKKPTTLMDFCRNKFFNTCEALALLRVNRFWCGFFLGFMFFTEHITDNVVKVSRHKLCKELTLKSNIIWLSIKIIFERIFSRLFQRWSMRVSSSRLCMIIMTGFNSFGYIYSW